MPARNVQLTATLTSDGTPVSGKTINFYYRVTGATTWTDAGAAVTDANGNATVTVSLTAPQTYDFRAEFAGDGDYEASYAEVDSYRIKARTTVTLTIAPQ
jgi:hypothetical protein